MNFLHQILPIIFLIAIIGFFYAIIKYEKVGDTVESIVSPILGIMELIFKAVITICFISIICYLFYQLYLAVGIWWFIAILVFLGVVR